VRLWNVCLLLLLLFIIICPWWFLFHTFFLSVNINKFVAVAVWSNVYAYKIDLYDSCAALQLDVILSKRTTHTRLPLLQLLLLSYIVYQQPELPVSPAHSCLFNLIKSTHRSQTFQFAVQKICRTCSSGTSGNAPTVYTRCIQQGCAEAFLVAIEARPRPRSSELENETSPRRTNS